MKTTHTPRLVIQKSPIKGANYELWVEGEGRKAGYAYTEEDAGHFVRAVNAHEALVEALQMALDEKEGWGHYATIALNAAKGE